MFELKTDKYGEDVTWELFEVLGDADSYPTEFHGSIYEPYSTHQIPMCLPKRCFELVIEDSTYTDGSPGSLAVQSYSVMVDGKIVASGTLESSSEIVIFGDSEDCLEDIATLIPTRSPTPAPTLQPTKKKKRKKKVEPELEDREEMKDNDDLLTLSNTEQTDEEDIANAPQDSLTSSAFAKKENTICAVVISTFIYCLPFL